MYRRTSHFIITLFVSFSLHSTTAASGLQTQTESTETAVTGDLFRDIPASDIADSLIAPVRMVLTPGANSARYLGREQLAGFDFPNDAVGETGDVTGTARTEFTFEEFEMEKPSVGSVLSVADAIRLEFDFTMTQENLVSQ